MRNISVLIQARMSSNRLPGKVLSEVMTSNGDKCPMLQYQIERLHKISSKVKLGVVTSMASSDDPIYNLCKNLGIYCYRGSENDLLDRYYNASKELNAEIVVRVLSDCPLLDPEIIDKAINKIKDSKFDFIGSTEPLPTTFPDGMDVSVFTFDALKNCYEYGMKPSEREHVTFHITSNPKEYKIAKLNLDDDLSKFRLCVDYEEDLILIRKIIEISIENGNYYPTMYEIINIVKSKNLFDINKEHTFGEGWSSAFEKDKYSDKADGTQAKPLLLKKTDEAWHKQIKYIPGGAQTFSKMPNAHVDGAAPKLLLRGKGGRVWDLDDNEYCDFVLGLGPIIIGHCCKEVDDAYAECASQYFSNPSLGHPLEADFSEKLTEIIPCAEMIRFGKNGSDATAGAVRLARGVTGRNIILCCGYHGWQDWFIGQTPRNRGIPKSIGEMTIPFRYNDMDNLNQLFKEYDGQVAALIMEPMGAEFPEDNYLQNVKNLCHENGSLLVFDEVCTGFRFDLGGAQKVFDVTPDIGCFGKAVANGYPLSIIAGKKEYLEQFEDVFFSFTYGGELPAIAAALKTIEILERDKVIEDIIRKGTRIIEGFNNISKDLGIDYMRAYGHGSWPKYEIDAIEGYTSNQVLTLFQQELVRRGMLTRTTPFICFDHSPADIENLLLAMKKSMKIVNDAITNRTIMDKIDGEIIRTIIRDENIKH